MKNRPAYIALRQAVIDNNYTIQQVQGATVAQAANLANVSEKDIAPYINGIKTKIIAEMKYNTDDTEMEAVKSQFLNWLNNNYPANVVEKDIENGKLKITIWPKGKP